jgi:DNA-binding NtrC family response regulator
VLFLDEIGEIPLSTQAKLLRLIEERAFVRIGGEVPIKSSARIICATNVDLARAVAEGRFRKDLYYRINVISVEVPPLRDREEDVLSLAQKFMREFAKAFARELQGFTPSAEQALLDYSWPGNVRELRNCVERGAALSEGPWIGVGTLFPSQAAEPEAAPSSFRTLADVRSDAERRHIRTVLADASGRVEEAAKLLGISRSTLFEKMRKLDIRL